ncbi:Actin cortical patch SUR7/pH-response regulator PalI [Penicillium camemberti]|uniref:Actin cortical patch SUR7/pH-response regulator PalI n=1 Tax=Penicillium camemberti (strain FM 013) TaxID=1429867 RepID=A0A0G4PN11_PENC3|nr:Actin cortical patch SUR7/pH-response regulator PalI [Penicillium camemberti]
MLRHVGKILPLAFSIAALVCLAIVFAGCTSTSSPNELYFLKVELTNFPEIGSVHPRRSLGIAAVDGIDVANKASSEANSVMNSASTDVIYASGAAETAASQVTDKIQSLSNEINSHLPGFYSVGLWGYCQGQKETSYSNCSQPSTSFSFDLLSILGSVTPVIDGVLPDENNKVLAGYHVVSRWSISAYILGFVSTFVAVVFGVTTMFFSRGKILLIISSLSATIFVAGASIGVTVIYGLITGAIQSILHPLGADASFGAHSFAATWLAVTFSFAALLTWLIEMFCCCI